MKRWICLLSAVLILALLAVPAAAAQAPAACVRDTAEILNEAACQELNRLAQSISQEQQCAVYIVTVPDYRDYGQGSIFEVAMGIYRDNDLGMGTGRDGVMLLLSMAERDYCLLAYGFGDTALTDYGKDYISGKFLDDFRSNDWYDGFADYLSASRSLLSQARAGKIYDAHSRFSSGMLWLWSVVIGVVAALITCLCQLVAMQKKVRMQTGALGYLDHSSLNITKRRDRYTHSTQIRREIQKNNGSGSSGGGHSHSDGFSGKSGKF